ncbi:hypothetical protein [Nocardioides sp. SYSU DS0651]|uniref:hypothetical protein n=1 Tax=Nocardioides sp. SYSU DS0651 TaxID=3415955 RepID=UPI003F4C5643
MTRGSEPIEPDRPATWQEALDRLEAHADRAEKVIRGMAVDKELPWSPPTHLGPIPEEFLARARRLLERQQRLMGMIPSVLADTRQQQRVADRVSDATTARVSPVYLDVIA